VLGAATALGTAAVLRRTLLRSRLARPMALELPGYRRPSVRQALMTTWDRGVMFLRKAGTVILGMVVALWWLGSYPITPPPPEAVELRQQAEVAPEPELAASLEEKADSLEARAAQANSFMGRIGRTVAPVFEPLGYDWQITIGVMSSFAAREVFVSTMAVVLATGEETLETEEALDRIKASTRSDGQTPVFTRPAAWSLLVFYVLAMQCLPTLAVTAREAGGWKWAGIQLGYMTALAYAGGLIAYNMAVWLG
jgi:ferrous iron transport protein B